MSSASLHLPHFKPSDILTWPSANYTNPHTRRPVLLATEIALTAVTSVVVALRVYSRARFTVSRLEWNDYLIVLATLVAISVLAVNSLAVEHGWGRHVWDVPLRWLEILQRSIIANEILFVLVVGLTKISILVFYLNIFSGYGTFRWLALGGLAYVIIWTIVCCTAVIFQCWPVNGFWDPNAKNARCHDMYVGIMVISILNCVSDIYLFAIPLKWVWKLNLPKKQRFGLVAAFGLGLITCIVGLIRLYYVKLTMHDSYDVSWNGAMLYIVSMIEADLGIICASLPSLKPLLLRFLSKKRDRYTGYTARYRRRRFKRRGAITSLTSPTEGYGLIRSTSFADSEVFELAMNNESREDFEIRVSEYYIMQRDPEDVGIAI